jgi:ferritin-like metal-binding protein YciE
MIASKLNNEASATERRQKQFTYLRESKMELESLQDLFVDSLKDLYSAETQITKALPKVIKAASTPELQEALQNHLEETEEQIERLEKIFHRLGEKPTGKKCKAMEGLVAENKEMIEENAEPEVMDAGLIVGCQKIEHYEIAGYGAMITFAKILGDNESAKLLQQTLAEEEKADKKLTEVAQSTINVQAAANG